jgi:hypothetical protein
MGSPLISDCGMRIAVLFILYIRQVHYPRALCTLRFYSESLRRAPVLLAR